MKHQQEDKTNKILHGLLLVGCPTHFGARPLVQIRKAANELHKIPTRMADGGGNFYGIPPPSDWKTISAPNIPRETFRQHNAVEHSAWHVLHQFDFAVRFGIHATFHAQISL